MAERPSLMDTLRRNNVEPPVALGGPDTYGKRRNVDVEPPPPREEIEPHERRTLLINLAKTLGENQMAMNERSNPVPTPPPDQLNLLAGDLKEMSYDDMMELAEEYFTILTAATKDRAMTAHDIAAAFSAWKKQRLASAKPK